MSPTIRYLCLILLLGYGPPALAQAIRDCTVPADLPTSRPDPEGVPTEVSVSLYLIDLRKIDETEQAFDADILVRAGWRDPRLVDPLHSLAGCRVSVDSIWNPELVFLNERRISRRLEDVAFIDAEGAVLYPQRFQGTFSSRLSLQEFPFDRQSLRISILSRANSPERIRFSVDPSITLVSDQVSETEWTVRSLEGMVSPFEIQGTHGSFTIARIEFVVEVARVTGFYLWKALAPLTLIIFMAWSVFWISPGKLPAQIGVATSAVFTLIAFQFSLGYLLPRLSYLTRADRFLLGSTVLVFTAFGEAILTGMLADSERLELAQRIDRHARWIYPLGFLIVVGWTAWA